MPNPARTPAISCFNGPERRSARRNIPDALKILDATIALLPDWAEGWNARATARYLDDDYNGSMADIAQTLKREPQHLGALMGMAAILEARGKKEDALKVYERALAIAPHWRNAQEAADKLKAALAGRSFSALSSARSSFPGTGRDVDPSGFSWRLAVSSTKLPIYVVVFPMDFLGFSRPNLDLSMGYEGKSSRTFFMRLSPSAERKLAGEAMQFELAVTQFISPDFKHEIAIIR